MLPFFRKIRYRLAEDNQFLKYSRYAVGEIVLVVLGILIALQINKWNEERKDINKSRAILGEFKKDLASDTTGINLVVRLVHGWNVDVTRSTSLLILSTIQRLEGLQSAIEVELS